MTKVRMDQRYSIWVELDPETGGVWSTTVLNNAAIERFDISDLSKAPSFVADRIALMKLTDVNKTEKGEILGRKITENVIIIYISYDEYQQIKEECK